MEFIQIQVVERAERGSRTMRRLRADGRIPGVLYGLQRRNLPIEVTDQELDRFMRTGSHLVELKMGDQTRPAILREVQMDPLTDEILHVDFVRVDKDKEIEDHVPVVLKGRAKGVAEGGLLHHALDEILVRSRPSDIPREIIVDISDLDIGDAINVGDLPAPAGVTFAQDADELVVHVTSMKEEEVPEPVEGETAAEPELIKKGDEDGEEAEEA